MVGIYSIYSTFSFYTSAKTDLHCLKDILMFSGTSCCPTAPPAGQKQKHLCGRAGEIWRKVWTHIGPCDLSIDVSRHVSAAVLLLQLSLVGGQPLLQGGALLLELLRQRQSFFQVLLALRYLEREGILKKGVLKWSQKIWVWFTWAVFHRERF